MFNRYRILTAVVAMAVLSNLSITVAQQAQPTVDIRQQRAIAFICEI